MSGAEGSGSWCSVSKRRGGAVARSMLGQSMANSTRASRERKCKGWPVGPGQGERQRLVGLTGRERGKLTSWASGPKAKEGRRE
jgi:hypothetical protein